MDEPWRTAEVKNRKNNQIKLLVDKFSSHDLSTSHEMDAMWKEDNANPSFA